MCTSLGPWRFTAVRKVRFASICNSKSSRRPRHGRGLLDRRGDVAVQADLATASLMRPRAARVSGLGIAIAVRQPRQPQDSTYPHVGDGENLQRCCRVRVSRANSQSWLQTDGSQNCGSNWDAAPFSIRPLSDSIHTGCLRVRRPRRVRRGGHPRKQGRLDPGRSTHVRCWCSTRCIRRAYQPAPN
jgi:hypothetical protein